jgi:hypothetical protein
MPRRHSAAPAATHCISEQEGEGSMKALAGLPEIAGTAKIYQQI